MASEQKTEDQEDSSPKKKGGSTVVQSHVDVMQSIMDFWWDEEGPAMVLHEMNVLRVPFVRDGLLEGKEVVHESDSLKGFTILDVGCGGGILTEALAKMGAKVHGLDASADLIGVAREHIKSQPGLDVEYIVSTIEEFSESNINVYDAVVVSEVIEHIEEKDLFLKHCVKTLKPGCSIYFSTFNRTFYAWLYGIIVAEYVLNFIPRGTHEYRLFISPGQLSELLKKYNCNTVLVKGAHLNCYKMQWNWTWNVQLTYFLQAVKEK